MSTFPLKAALAPIFTAQPGGNREFTAVHPNGLGDDFSVVRTRLLTDDPDNVRRGGLALAKTEQCTNSTPEGGLV
jgi:hypothetical protein